MHYYPFGMAMEGAWMDILNDPENKYLYNGKEIADDYGLNWHYYGFRNYDAAIGRFPSIDPIADNFAFVSGYNYAENEPVGHIDLYGLQQADAPKEGEAEESTYKVTGIDDGTSTLKEREMAAFSSYKARNIEDGYGDPEWNVFSLEAKSTKADFEKLKTAYSTSPGIVQNNEYATYTSYDITKDGVLNVGEGMKIDIKGMFNGIVRFTDIQVKESSFSVSAEIIEAGTWIPLSLGFIGLSNYNHPDAGHINFSGSFDENSGIISFQITNQTTLGNWGTNLASGQARTAQANQWAIVLSNVEKYINSQETYSKMNIRSTSEGKSITDYLD